MLGMLMHHELARIVPQLGYLGPHTIPLFKVSAPNGIVAPRIGYTKTGNGMSVQGRFLLWFGR